MARAVILKRKPLLIRLMAAYREYRRIGFGVFAAARWALFVNL